MNIVSRLAPTPSGYLHLGNVFNFMLTWLLVRSRNGKLHLRIDDLDASRANPIYINHIFDVLHWLKIDYDAGPKDVNDFRLHYSQQLRVTDYEQYINQLKEKGLLYVCTCSRKEIEQHWPDGIYRGLCRHKNLPFNAPDAAWRMKTNPDDVITFKDGMKGVISIPIHDTLGDFIIKRKDGIPAYQIASLADDVAMGVNLVVRGEDLLPSTAAQLWLAELLQLNHFNQTQFYHHPLLTESNGQKLSKSDGSTSIQAMRESGKKPQDILKTFCRWMQWENNPQHLSELIPQAQKLLL